MSGINNIFLSSTAQTQLSKLKAANAVPLNRIDSSISNLKARQPVLNTVKTELTELQTAFDKVKSASDADRPDAIKKFVSEFNDLQRQLTSTTAKEGALKSIAGVRDAKSSLRDAFANFDVLSSLKDAGIQTTRNGLEATGGSNAALSETAILQLESTFSKVASRLSSAESQVTSQLNRLSDNRERIEASVNRANIRTEKSFLKYQQMMQMMNQGESANTLSMFA